MRFVVIAPARRASRRLANKMLADIGGDAMIVRTLRRAQQSDAAAVLATSDDDEVLQVCRAAGFEVIKTGAHESGSARIAEAAAIADIKDMIVNVQGDEPFIEPNVINSVAALLHRRADCVCASAMRKLHNAEEFGDSAVVKVITDRAGCALYFSRAQIPAAKDSDIAPSLDIARAHIGIYAYRPDFLQQLSQLSPSPMEQSESLEQLRILWHGEKIAMAEVASQSFGVDTAADLERARKCAQ